MKTKCITLVTLLLASQAGQAFACAVCYGGKDSQATKHIAVAIWFLLGSVVSVLGGVGAFGIHLWRHSRTPLEPHQELAEEDFDQYD